MSFKVDEVYMPLEGKTIKATNKDDIKPLSDLEYTNPLIETVETLFNEALGLLKKKNHDYTPKDDPISNFRLADTLGITSTERAIMVRLMDKITRIAVGLNKDYMVKDEKMKDNILDAINYLGILYYALEVDNNGKGKTSIDIDDTRNNTNDR